MLRHRETIINNLKQSSAQICFSLFICSNLFCLLIYFDLARFEISFVVHDLFFSFRMKQFNFSSLFTLCTLHRILRRVYMNEVFLLKLCIRIVAYPKLFSDGCCFLLGQAGAIWKHISILVVR